MARIVVKFAVAALVMSVAAVGSLCWSERSREHLHQHHEEHEHDEHEHDEHEHQHGSPEAS